MPECSTAAISAGAPVKSEPRNGNGRVTFTRPGGVQLDQRIEIYTSRQNVDAIRAILAGTGMPFCYEVALEKRADTEPETTLSDIDVSSFVVQPGPAELGLAYPASHGFAADSGFAYGVNVTFTKTTDGSSEPVAMRVITFGTGGLMSTLTLIGATPADLDAVHLTGMLRVAAKNLTGMFGPAK